jgi:ribosomal protein L11 methyltransferase
MFYTRLKVTCASEFSEILIAEMVEAGFDSFLETDEGFEAYVENEKFDLEQVSAVRKKYEHVNPLIFVQDRIQKKNWNEEWERNLQPIVVDSTCLIRAEFHVPEKHYPYEIVITPKMSFGTGHHPTTYLMIRNQMTIDHRQKRVMDAGCGTAILSVMASKLGAQHIEAFDVDEWSVINGKENIDNNRCAHIRIRQGKIEDLDFTGKFDIVLANINKNILLLELKTYARYLADGGKLLMSGFYSQDADDLKKEGIRYGLHEVHRDERETWATLLLEKK